MLQGSNWRTPEAKLLAKELLRDKKRPRLLEQIVNVLFVEDDPQLRSRMANVAHWMTEEEPEIFSLYADEIIGLLASLSLEENWSRYHLGLVAARSALTQAQHLRAAEMMRRLADDEQNVIRVTALEGFVHLAIREQSLQEEARTLLENARRNGTPAMKARARRMLKRLQSSQKVRPEVA